MRFPKPPALFTRPLHTVGRADLPRVGGKAAHLGEMIAAGLPVPRGFCVTTAAFDEFLVSCPKRAELLLHWSRDTNPDLDSIAKLSREAKFCLAEARMPEAVRKAVLASWQELGETRCFAVRSSATVEDAPAQSFAGQFESILNVRGTEALLDAVKTCWQSLFSQRALSYLARQRVRLEQVKMAVVVQEMVDAEHAGVVFTADPLTGISKQLVVEYVSGLGDKLVQGMVQPKRIVLNKGDSFDETTKWNKHPPDHPPDRLEACPTWITRLCDLARRTEGLFGAPQDIEWAEREGEVFLLQARPITTRKPVRRWEDRQVWSNLNSGEVAPDVMTPVSWSIICTFLNRIAASMFRLMGADVSRSPIVGRVAGRAYFNANTGLAVMKPFFFLLKRIPNFAQALGGGQIEWHRQGLLDIPDEDLPDVGFSWPKYILSWPRILVSLVAHSPRRGDAWTTRLKAQQDALTGVDLASKSTPELIAFFEGLLQKGFEGWDLLYLFTQAAALPVFQKACRDWLGDPDLAMGYRLFAGLGGMSETEAGHALWRQAVLAHADRETENAVIGEGDWTDVRGKLDQADAGRRFLSAWQAFMREHGHHCRGELELFNPRWSERPDYILNLVRGYLRAVGQTNPLENHRRLAQEREQLTASCRQRLKNPVKRWVFSRALRRAQKLAVNREEWKSQAVRHLTLLRQVLLTLGERLWQAGILAVPDDIFFLEVTEIVPIATGQALFDARAVIGQRRAEYEKNLTLTPPPVVFGRFEPAAQKGPAVDTSATVLHGIPIFPGVVTGPARVILRTDDHEQVLPGEILIAPFTDPAWTPYFVTAAAVVMDQGGILSHGSIIAREYGLPAVTNVGSATRIICTGQVIRVDGERGEVRVVTGEAAAN